MKNRQTRLQLLKILILGALFYTAVYFENAQQRRLLVLCSVFAAYIALGLGRGLLKGREPIFSLSFLLDIALVYTLEYHSRLLINYFFHSFYIIILLEAALALKRKSAAVVGILAVVASIIKYILLLYFKFNLSNVSQTAFFLMMNIFILVIVSFAQYNKEEKEKKDILYKELLETHKQLKQYTDEVNRLAVIGERNRIARDIHDGLGHNMTALIMQLEMMEHMLAEDSQKARGLLERAKKTARESMAGIREVVDTLRGEDEAPIAEGSIKSLVSEFSARTGIKVKLNLSGEERTRFPEAQAALFRIVREALTNSARHGNATEVSIDIVNSEKIVEFHIKDNGTASDFVEGYGLKGIRERVKALGGQVEFHAGDGFDIKGMMKLEAGSND